MVNARSKQHDIFVAELDRDTLEVVKTSVFTDVYQFSDIYSNTFSETFPEQLEMILTKLPPARPIELRYSVTDPNRYLLMKAEDLSTFNRTLDQLVERRKKYADTSPEDLADTIRLRFSEEALDELTSGFLMNDKEMVAHALKKSLEHGLSEKMSEFYLYPVVVDEDVRTGKTEIVVADYSWGVDAFGFNLIDYIDD